MSSSSLLKKGLPYDAEIEYLESTGTQYINTLYVLKANDVVELVVCNTTADFVENKGWGTGNSNEPGAEHDLGGGLRYSNGQICCWYWGRNYTFSPKLTNTTPYNYYHEEAHFSAPKGYVQLEDLTTRQVYNITSITLSTFPSLSVNIFKGNGSYPYWGKKRFKHFRITNNNTPILDLIPVRIGNIGYMYDKVSGQLFGNAGTGSFILGADKTN